MIWESPRLNNIKNRYHVLLNKTTSIESPFFNLESLLEFTLKWKQKLYNNLIEEYVKKNAKP